MTLLKKLDSGTLLRRILADPGLPEKVRRLEPRELARLVNQVGLEDCAEIVALASSEQIERIFDEDLWRSPKPGGDEEFDLARFTLWIEILEELGVSQAAEKFAEMDPDFLAMAVSQLIWVVPFEELRDHIAEESRIEKALSSNLSYEIDRYAIIARDARGWDALLALLVELDQNHGTLLQGILERCAFFSSETMADQGGLYEVLTLEQQLIDDVAYEREKRRVSEGHVPPAEARAFLKLAAGPVDQIDLVSPARFRNLLTEAASPSVTASALVPKPGLYSRVHDFLEKDPSSRTLRIEELNYLANVLVAGGDLHGRSPRPGEAARMVLETCEAGLARNPSVRSLTEAFREAWPKVDPADTRLLRRP